MFEVGPVGAVRAALAQQPLDVLGERPAQLLELGLVRDLAERALAQTSAAEVRALKLGPPAAAARLGAFS